MKTQSHSVARVVRLSAAELDGPDWLARHDGRGLVRSGAGRAKMQDVAEIAGQPDAELERGAGAFWPMMFSLMEGFALYGAALHPTAALPVEAILAARRDLEPQPEVSEREEPQGRAEANGNVVELDRVRPLDVRSRWRWLRAAAGRVAALRAYLRREREVGRAVAALEELDDRTLRDLGIRCRSEIEWTVRYCRDC